MALARLVGVLLAGGCLLLSPLGVAPPIISGGGWSAIGAYLGGEARGQLRNSRRLERPGSPSDS